MCHTNWRLAIIRCPNILQKICQHSGFVPVLSSHGVEQQLHSKLKTQVLVMGQWDIFNSELIKISFKI